MTDSGKITAPWSIEHVRALNRHQMNGRYHPFTCANRGDGKHVVRFGDLGVLLATESGWYCLDCDYRQNWAWRGMTQPPPAGDIFAEVLGGLPSGDT